MIEMRDYVRMYKNTIMKEEVSLQVLSHPLSFSLSLSNFFFTLTFVSTPSPSPHCFHHFHIIFYILLFKNISLFSFTLVSPNTSAPSQNSAIFTSDWKRNREWSLDRKALSITSKVSERRSGLWGFVSELMEDDCEDVKENWEREDWVNGVEEGREGNQ